MTNVGDHSLTCLDGSDYAAIALSMQCNAEAIDDALSSIDTSLDDYLGRWWWSATNTSAINLLSTGLTIGPENLLGADLFTDGSIVAQANGFPAIGSFPSTFVWPNGIYVMGSTIKYTVATPTNNTIRTLLIYQSVRVDGIATIAPPGPGGPVYMSSEYERGAAGNDGSITVGGMFQVASDPTMSRFGAFFSHANTGSAIVIPVGAWRMWFLRLGSGLVV